MSLFGGVFPGGLVVMSPPARQDVGLILGLERSPEEGNGNPLQSSCLGIPKSERGAWRATVHGIRVRHNLVTKEQQDFCLFDLLWGQR